MDQLIYRYSEVNQDHYGNLKKDNNQLQLVNDLVLYDDPLINDITDQGSISSPNYTYDQKGRITQDVASGISSIEWTAYDKVKKINHADPAKPNIEFTYDSKQQRLTKKLLYTNSQNNVTTFYSYDASGILLALYEYSYNSTSSQWEYMIIENQIYGQSRIGKYQVNEVLSAATTLTNDKSKLHFELTDHLGSVRAVVSGQKIDFDNDNNANEPEVLSLTDYHEFGMTMQGRSFISSSGNYRFGYQGSERDPEALAGSAYTTEFRMLDPRLGRWFKTDNVIQPWISPYNSMDNNPIIFTDKGGDTVAYFNRMTGAFLGFMELDKKGIIGALYDLKEKKVVRQFTFNDLENGDRNLLLEANKDALNGIQRQMIRVVDRDEVNEVTKRGLSRYKSGSLLGKYRYLYKYSKDFKDDDWEIIKKSKPGLLDFTFQLNLQKEPKSKLFYLLENNKAYNNFDFGNFLWGNSTARLGVGIFQARAGAHLNNS